MEHADPWVWLSEYLPSSFYDPFTPIQKAIITDINRVATYGGYQAIGGYRECGKSTITQGLMLYFAARGLLKFTVIIGANGASADDAIETIKGFVEEDENEQFRADYPEICAPVIAISGTNYGAKTQVGPGGRRTRINWAGDNIRLPDVEGRFYSDKVERSRASGAIIMSRGIDSAVKSLKVGKQRPQLIVLEDIDVTGESDAVSKIKTEKVDNEYTKLGSGKNKIAIAMLANTPKRTSVGFIFTDREARRIWNGRRYRFMEKMPADLALVDKYVDIRREKINDNVCKEADDFYIANQDAIDSGFEPADPDSYDAGVGPDGRQKELSAVHRFLNLVADNGWASVKANELLDPITKDELSADANAITPEFVIGRSIGIPRGVVPEWADMVVLGADVRKFQIHWVLDAYSMECDRHTMDIGIQQVYGVNPESDKGVEFKIAEAVRNVWDIVGRNVYSTMDGRQFNVTRGMIDSRWQKNGVVQACTGIEELLPVMGCGRGMATTFRSPKRDTQTERKGHEFVKHWDDEFNAWIMYLNSDHGKKFIRNRLQTGKDKTGAWTIFQQDEKEFGDLSAFAKQICNDRYDSDKRKWMDEGVNHWGDSAYYSQFGAWFEGVRLMGETSAAERIQQGITFAQQQAQQLRLAGR